MKKTALALEHALFKVAGWVLIFPILSVIGSMLLMTVDVIGRYFFSLPVPGGDALISFMMVPIVLLPAAYINMEKRHIKIDLVTRHLPPRVAALYILIILFISIWLFAVATITGWTSAMRALKAGDFILGIVHYPVWPARFFVPLGTGLITLSIIPDIVRSFQVLFGRAKLELGAEREPVT